MTLGKPPLCASVSSSVNKCPEQGTMNKVYYVLSFQRCMVSSSKHMGPVTCQSCPLHGHTLGRTLDYPQEVSPSLLAEDTEINSPRITQPGLDLVARPLSPNQNQREVPVPPEFQAPLPARVRTGLSFANQELLPAPGS